VSLPQPTPASRPVEPDPDFDLRPFLDFIAAGLAGGANVVMQLSWPEVGYGVHESKWDRGALVKHPFKRARTTGTYLAVAMVGTDRDIAIFREAVNDAHRVVRSGPDSPVAYNAFSPELQLWVAACLFYGPYDYYCRVYGEPRPEVAEAFYRHCSRFATSLQVPSEKWPATLADFWDYWEASLARVSIDDTIREMLVDILSARFLPRPLPWLVGPAVRFVNVGFLPAEFRDAMGLTWTEADERRLRRVLRGVRLLNRLIPGPIRRAPVYFNLWDMRLRHRLGLRLT
jgi:uncharacterized protein (DUF2236 family)